MFHFLDESDFTSLTRIHDCIGKAYIYAGTILCVWCVCMCVNKASYVYAFATILTHSHQRNVIFEIDVSNSIRNRKLFDIAFNYLFLLA